MKYHYYIWKPPLSSMKWTLMDYDKVNLMDYVLVYEFESDEYITLDMIYDTFSQDPPEDYHSMLMCIGDVIVIRAFSEYGGTVEQAYVVDIQGFKMVKTT